MTMLSERDLQILQLVRQHKFVTTRQLQRLLFFAHATIDAGTRACNRVLQRLRERRFLYRIERPIGGIKGGSGAFVWGLDTAGDRATRTSGAEDDKRMRAFEPTRLFLAHTLAITETHVLLEEAARTHPFELVEIVTEPANWRSHSGPGGEPRFLKPDLYVLTASGDYEDHWFIEIDQGTESLPTMLRKCHAYNTYRSSGQEQARSGVFPLVVWILSDAHRRRRLATEISADARLDSRLFSVVAPDELVPLIRAQPEAGSRD
ncbi:MAG: replication-relaxation family protein [Salinibacterium sp.]|nr:replication-relaxation family protein [Salinibacterium sp.]